MIVRLALACAALLCALSTPAEARRAKPVQCDPFDIMRPCGLFEMVDPVRATSARRIRLDRGAGAAIGLGARPRAWCGWWMRSHLGVANPAGNLARWWAGFGSKAAGPAVGALVVWRNHVGIITGQNGAGQWIVKSGNDGRAVRERPRSVAGAIAFRWPA